MEANRRIGFAWLALCAALALHVFDEAANGFLGVYNPTVEALRERIPWIPLPTFRFEAWLAGLIAGIAAMALASRSVFRGAKWTRPVARAVAIAMILNACGHIAGTVFGRTVEPVRFERPMPGFYSSPFLLAAAVALLLRLRAGSSRVSAACAPGPGVPG